MIESNTVQSRSYYFTHFSEIMEPGDWFQFSLEAVLSHLFSRLGDKYFP